ncbi:cytochrome P450 94A2-like [Rhodamnia argentea]|uniref:Cytochrome P450 94A2-like n=1 Tax=Rhodamnia argentea TaxID=178133 RepID=A0ABM3GTX1_9MYRT|nr:cytochrome P450 94A2-like [Rhodamnia argentea]
METIRAHHGKTLGVEGCSFEVLRKTDYLHAAITETMRLYPPMPPDRKEALMDDALPLMGHFLCSTPDEEELACHIQFLCNGKDGKHVGRRTVLSICRRGGSTRMGCSSQRALAGSRCFTRGQGFVLGKDLAYILMKSVLATVLERFEIEVQNEGKCPGRILSMTRHARAITSQSERKMSAFEALVMIIQLKDPKKLRFLSTNRIYALAAGSAENTPGIGEGTAG